MPRCYAAMRSTTSTAKINQTGTNLLPSPKILPATYTISYINGETSNGGVEKPEKQQGGGEWKTPSLQRPHSAQLVQQQNKEDTPGPVSPTEASVAPIYYNNTHENKNGKCQKFYIICTYM